MSKLPISVVIITKNEERNIKRALESVKDIASEIIVVDSGSTDRTVEIAKSYGAKVFLEEWKGYAKQKNVGIQRASNKWVLSIDADEELSKELQLSIKRLFERNPDKDCYFLVRKTFFLGKFLDHVWYPEYRIRLFKKDSGKFEGNIHEEFRCIGKTGRLEGDLYHYSFKSLRHQFSKAIDYAEIASKELYKKGKRASFKYLFLNPFWSFFKTFFLQKGFLDGKRGFIASVYMAFYTFMKYAFLYEKNLKEKYKDDLWKR